MDYSKWDKIQDSDDETEKQDAGSLSQETRTADEVEERRQIQERISKWLRKQFASLKKEEESPPTGPELTPRKALVPYRKLTKEEREVLAMVIVVCHFEEGQTNLTRHTEILELFRHHRWLEQDPGTLELLCRVHNAHMRNEPRSNDDSDEEVRMRNMLLGTINAIGAPRQAKCPGGLLELVQMICTPESEAARELRKKWQLKDFAKDALFDSLFPDFKKDSEGSSSSESMWEVWLMVALVVLIFAGMGALFWFGAPIFNAGKTKRGAGAAGPSLEQGVEEL